MPGISIHVVDVSRGVVAAGLRVELVRCAADAPGALNAPFGPTAMTAPAAPEPASTANASAGLIADGPVGANGLLESVALQATFSPGWYEARFHVADYYRRTGVPLPGVPFLDVVFYRFGVDNPQQHYHLPFKMTPWGYSCFRGGA